MGILNVTPDSFAAAPPRDAEAARRARPAPVRGGRRLGGRGRRVDAARRRAGAPQRRSCARVVPVIEALRRRGAGPLSIDTTKAAVAAAALDAGADIVNDVSGFGYDPAMAALVAARGVPAVLMHLRGGLRRASTARRPTAT